MFNDPTGRKLIEEQRCDAAMMIGLCVVSGLFPWAGFIMAAIVAIAHGIDTMAVLKNEREINRK